MTMTATPPVAAGALPQPDRDRPTPPAAVAVPRRARERLLSLDVFRGLTVAGMLLVNNPGTWAAIYPPLEHAPWHGWTPTDLIFPFFLFIVGITTHLSLSERRARGDDDAALVRQIVKRAALIYLFGFAMSAFPFFTWNTVPGHPDASMLDRVVHRFQHVRIMGVLARIAVAYLIGALLAFRAPTKRVVITLAAVLYAYWLALMLLPVPGTGITGEIDVPSLTLQGWLDRLVIGRNHIWGGSVTYDPEGTLSTLGAVGSVLSGVLAGRWIATERPLTERLAGLFGAGALAAVAGLMWDWSLPINKNLWTSSYVLFMAGMGAMTLATCMWVIEVLGVRWWTKPFLIFGLNPIVAFVGSGVMARCIYTVFTAEYQGHRVPVQSIIFQTGFASWLPARDASLLFALVFVLLWLGILSVLHRKQWFLKL